MNEEVALTDDDRKQSYSGSESSHNRRRSRSNSSSSGEESDAFRHQKERKENGRRELDRKLADNRQERKRVENELRKKQEKSETAMREVDEEKRKLKQLEEEKKKLEAKKKTLKERSGSGSDSEKSDSDREKSESKKKMNKQIEKELREWADENKKEKSAEKREKQRKKRQEIENKRAREKREQEDMIEQLQKDLLKACEERRVDKLRQSVGDVEDHQLVRQLQRVYDKARALLTSLERIENLPDARKELGKIETVSKIRSYVYPPQCVHNVMKATLLVLGEDASTTKDWATCRPRCSALGRGGLHRRIKKFDANELDEKTATKALTILDQHSRDEVFTVCTATAAFYDWTAGVCEETRMSSEQKSSTVDKKRQKDRRSSLD